MIDPCKDLQSLADNYFSARKGTREGKNKWLVRKFVEFSKRKQKPPHLMVIKDIELFIYELRQEGYTSVCIACSFNFLRKFFDHLESLGLVQNNVARNTIARAEKYEPRYFTDAELIRVHHKYHPRK